ncbi:MAG: response regulator [Candidatus Acidiferrales bacterium]
MSIKVLLADDNEPVRNAIRRLLVSDPEIQLLAEATTFFQTIQMARELRPQVIVMDLHMSDEKDVQPSQVRSSLAGSKIVAISIWNDADSKALADTFGALSLLDKIDLAARLIPTIKQHARGSHQIDLRQEDLQQAE